MRISDWSSDVCSSDLLGILVGEDGIFGVAFDNFELAYVVATLCLAIILFDGGLRTSSAAVRQAWAPAAVLATFGVLVTGAITGLAAVLVLQLDWLHGLLVGAIVRSEERRVGNGGVSTCRCRWLPCH